MTNPAFAFGTNYSAQDSLPVCEKVTVALAAGAANSFDATITAKDKDGVAIAGRQVLEVYVTSDAEGDGLTSTAASGALTASTGVILTALTAKKHVRLITNAAGVAVLNLVDSAKTQGERIVAVVPNTGRTVVSDATVTATYG